LDSRGWVNKRFETQIGTIRGGKSFTKTHLHRMLTHVAYIGKIEYRDEIHQGEHPAIVDPGVFEKVQQTLNHNARTAGAGVRNRFGSFLKGILRCSACDCSMTPAHSTKKGSKRYRYYVCCNAQKRGWDVCPSKSVPASQIEEFVVERIRCIGRDPELIRETVAHARQQDATELDQLDGERRALERDLGQRHADVRKYSAQLGTDDSGIALTRLAEAQERIRALETRIEKVREQIHTIRRRMIEESEVADALREFDAVWQSLPPREQEKLVQLLVERVDYDGGEGKLAITFHPTGIQKLADQLSQSNQRKEKRA
jgi:site-specific DNA recombinase